MKAPISLALVCIMLIGSASAQDRKDFTAPSDKRISIRVFNRPLYEVLSRLINVYDIAFGFEQSPLDNEHGDYGFDVNVPYKGMIHTTPSGKVEGDDMGTPVVEGHFITLDYHDARVADVLDDIVKQMSHYKWKLDGDVVEIFPSGERDKQIEELLQLNLKGFSLSRGQQIFRIKDELVKLPEVLRFMNDRKLVVDPYTRVSFSHRELTVDLQYTQLTFKDLLNRITKVKRGGWIVRRCLHGYDLDLAI